MAVHQALVVDDSKSARIMLSRLLQKGGLTVDLVESAEEAIEYLNAKKPDLIFMDHMMPGMDGLEAASVISQNPNTSSIPIVMYTSKEGEDYIAEAKAHGAIAILPKPAKPHQIASVIDEINLKLSSAADVLAKPAVIVQEMPVSAASSSVPSQASVSSQPSMSEQRIEELIRTQVSTQVQQRVEAQVQALFNQFTHQTIPATVEQLVQKKLEAEGSESARRVDEASVKDWQARHEADLSRVHERMTEFESQQAARDERINQIQHAIDSLKAEVNEAKQKMVQQLEQQEQAFTTLSEKVGNHQSENMTADDVAKLVADGVEDRSRPLHQELENIKKSTEAATTQFSQLVTKIEDLSESFNATPEFDEGLRSEVKALAEAAGASAGATAANEAAEQATNKIAPEYIDSALEQRLGQVSKVYLDEAKTSRRTSLLAALLGVVALGAVVYKFII